jgi:hypothetical protein
MLEVYRAIISDLVMLKTGEQRKSLLITDYWSRAWRGDEILGMEKGEKKSKHY